MHQSLNSLPQPLLNHLGACSRLDSLTEFPQVTVPLRILRQHKNADPYHIAIDAQGLTLTLQCTNPNAQPDEHQWGLHGITLNAATWDGEWPTGLNPQEATAADVVRLLAANPEEAMNTPTLVCFAIDGMNDLTWALMAMFDPGSLKLQTLTLQRSGEWVVAADEKLADAPAS